MEIYENHKLGRRDALRRMVVNEAALLETRVTSLEDLMVAEGMTPSLEDIYDDYHKAKTYKIMIRNAKPRLDAYLKKEPLMKSAYVAKYASSAAFKYSYVCAKHVYIVNDF